MTTGKPSNKSFGILFFAVFLIVGLWPILKSEDVRIWSLIISIIFLVLGLFNSRLLNPLNKFWMKLGELLGKIIPPIVMAGIFFVIMTPMSFLIKIFGKDLLKLKFTNEHSYWFKREKNVGSMDRQF
ncbi:MAG: hypothetical protein ISQ33_01940 [Candidatus Pelagibacter bacterium]|jgi:hypothetical protein|nr:hypothetical protein [Candidatus Pelagibacter bacterium]